MVMDGFYLDILCWHVMTAVCFSCSTCVSVQLCKALPCLLVSCLTPHPSTNHLAHSWWILNKPRTKKLHSCTDHVATSERRCETSRKWCLKPLDHDNLSVTECHGLFKHVHMGICGDTWWQQNRITTKFSASPAGGASTQGTPAAAN